MGTAAIVAIVILTAAFLLPGAGYSPKAFGGVGPGGPVVAAGLLLLGAAAWLAPVERSSPPAPASLPRLVLAGLLVVLSAALVAPALTIADWYNSLDDGRSYTIAFPDLGRSLANSADPSRLDRAFVPLVCFSLGIAAVAVVLALIRPVGTRALRAVAVGIGVLAPALLLLYFSRSWGRADLTAQGYVHDAPYNPFVGLHAGFWMYAGGCGLLVLAAVAAPPRKVAPALGSPA